MESPADVPETEMAPESSSSSHEPVVGEIEGHRISIAEIGEAEITPQEKMELDIEELVNSSIEELISSSAALRSTGDAPHQEALLFSDEASQPSTSEHQLTPHDDETLTEAEAEEMKRLER